MAASYFSIRRDGYSDELVDESGWVNAEPVGGSAINLTSDEDDQVNGLVLTFVTNSNSFSGVGSSLAGQDGASWVPAKGLHGGLRSTQDTNDFEVIRFSGLSNGAVYDLRFAGSSSGTRGLAFKVSGRDTQEFDTYDFLESAPSRKGAATFLAVSPDSGIIDVEWRAKNGSGPGYLSALSISAAEATPAVTTTDTLQPGTEFTLTATNFASAPVSPVTLTDTEGSTITVAVTISGSGPYTAVGTMPTLAEAVTAGTSLLFGDVTIELST